MQKKTRIAAGAGGALVLIAAAAGIAFAQHEGGPMSADANGDGQISAQEIEASARTRFAAADADKDGKLTGDEIPHRRGGRGGHDGHWGGRDGDGPPPPPPQAQTQTAPPGEPAGAARPQRPKMDADGDGAVTLPEFYAQMRDRLLRADANKDGNVSAEELDAARSRRGRRHGDRDER